MNKNTQKSINKLDIQDYEALLTAVGEVALLSVTNAKGDIIYVNDKFVEISKYTREELIGQNHRILKSGHQPQEMFVELWKTISSGKIWRGEIKNKAKDGSYYWVDTSIAPILDSVGKPERYIAVRMLVSDRKMAEEKIVNQNKAMLNVMDDLNIERQKLQDQIAETQKFALATEASGEHVIITDRDGIIIYANHAAEVTTGFSKKEMIGTKAGILWGGKMESSFYRDLWHTIKVDKKVFQGDFNNVRKNGENYTASATISPVLDKNGNIILFIGNERDTTKEKKIDKAKTEFVSLASHQLRTPLSAINWYAEMLLAGDAGVLNDEQNKYMKEIYAGNQRMVELVNSLLNVSRLELGTFNVEPLPTAVVQIAEAVLKELLPEIIERKIVLKTKFDRNLSTVINDPKLIRMVFQNLISNAIKYTPIGGSVEVEVVSCDMDKTFEIRVQDSGIGIPSGERDKIFTKLFRATNARESDTDGTGLGLYIVKSIVENMQGSISFESEENKGTTFIVRLPVVGPKARSVNKLLGD